MFFAWSLQNFLELHNHPEIRCTGSMSAKNRTYVYSRGDETRSTTMLRPSRFLKKLKILRTMFQVFGALRELSGAKIEDFSSGRRINSDASSTT